MNRILKYDLFSGFPYHYGNLCRALCCRLKDYFNSNQLNLPFRLNHPKIGYTNLTWNNKSDKPRSTNPYDSLNWNISDQSIEIIEPSTGKRKSD